MVVVRLVAGGREDRERRTRDRRGDRSRIVERLLVESTGLGLDVVVVAEDPDGADQQTREARR